VNKLAKAEIILYLEGDEEAVERIYKNIIYTDFVLNKQFYYTQIKDSANYRQISVEVTRTNLLEVK